MTDPGAQVDLPKHRRLTPFWLAIWPDVQAYPEACRFWSTMWTNEHHSFPGRIANNIMRDIHSNVK